jgi:ABC transport system ATP-binding/permease protein
MALLSLQDVTVSFGGPPVLENVTVQINPNERIGLVGRNGAGKSTLIRLIDGQISCERGEVARPQGLSVAMLSQEVPRDVAGTVFDEVARGLGPQAGLLAQFHQTSLRYAAEHTEALHAELVRLENALESHNAWAMSQRVEEVLSRMELSPDALCNDLSAGMKRRVLLAKAIVREPDILLLDEPTNHLDLAAINWLEDFLYRYDRTVLFITHDRMFLRKLATRILDIDRGRLTSWACDHPTYLERKAAALEAEEKQQALFDKRLAQEEVWIRTGIKARRTRNEGRVRALEKLREVRLARRERAGEVRMEMVEAERSGRLVMEAKNATFSYTPNGPATIQDLTTLVMRGDKIGIIGPNGAGKTTLLKLLLGEITPQSGSDRHGTKLEISYFDQLHAQLDEDRSIIENVTDGADRITVGGQSRHVIGYLEDFLFTPEQSRRAVKYLSGGERNRLLLARLFTRPSNVLVLDEPTNDLDLETLELLETLLAEYQGTVLLVSHDREFLNNVVTSTFVLEGQGVVKEYAGGYDDWLRQRDQQTKAVEKAAKAAANATRSAETKEPASSRRKLSFKEQRELDSLPKKIIELETEQQQLHEIMADSGFYRQESSIIAEKKARLATIESEIAQVYKRWEALEGA